MNHEYLPLLLIVALFPLTLLAKKLSQRALIATHVPFAAFFLLLGFFNERLRWPAFLFAVLAAGMALTRWGRTRHPQKT